MYRKTPHLNFKKRLCVFHQVNLIIFRRWSKNSPSNICEKSKKKLEKRKVRLKKNSIIKHFSTDQAQAKSLACLPKASRTILLALTIFTQKISYFYDIEILCEKQSYFHCVPRGKEDYCINIYMILMLILTLANPARVSLK